MNFFEQIANLPPEHQQAFHRWATALGQQEKEAKHIAKQYETGKLTPEKTWADVVKVYRGNQLKA